MSSSMSAEVREVLRRGTVIPASPLAIDARRKFDERRQRALWRYYAAAGAGGVAIGVHTTQFAIREPKIGLYEPLLALAKEEFDAFDDAGDEPMVRVAGICGRTEQAVAEAAKARDLGFHAGLVSLAAMAGEKDETLVAHCRAVGEVIDLFGFYLQPAVGGCVLSHRFWRRFAELDSAVAVKIAAFNRYQTIDVIRAVAESGRNDIALYTGNDDNIVIDLLTPYRFSIDGKIVERRMVGGLLGHWAFWTRRAVSLLSRCHEMAACPNSAPPDMLSLAIETTDANAAVFDVANNFAGCVPGVQEVLRRNGLLEGSWCLAPSETLGPGQSDEIDRVLRMYPHLTDDEFIEKHRDDWLE